MESGRRARAIVTYDAEDISEEIRKSLISITVTLNADSKTADDVTIEMHDRELNWIGPWYPKVRRQATESSGSASAANELELTDDDE